VGDIVVAAVTVEPVIVDPVTAVDMVVVYWGDVVIAVGDVVAGKQAEVSRRICVYWKI